MFSINPYHRMDHHHPRQNLHSTMFSINPVIEHVGPPPVGIYIPLCFLLIKHPLLAK